MKDYQFEDMDFMPSVSKVSLDINHRGYIYGIFSDVWEDNSVLKYSFNTVLLTPKIPRLELYSFVFKFHGVLHIKPH